MTGRLTVAVFGSLGGKGLGNRPMRLALLALLALAGVSLLSRLPAWTLGDLRAFDYLSTLDAPKPPADGPVIVAIDEPSLADINAQWPWPRQFHARLIQSLRDAGAKAIGLDIIMAEPSSPDNDAAMTAAVGPDVVLAGDETLIRTPQADQLIRTMPMPQLTEAGARAGIASINLGGDGIFRTVPPYPDGFAATLAAAAGVTVPALPEDALIQTYGPGRSYQTVSYYQALDPQNFLPPGFFRDRVVLVGLSLQNAPDIDKGGADAFATSYTVHTGKLVPGVEIQATIFDNLRLGSAILPAHGALNLFGVAVAVLAAALAVWRGTGWQTFGYAVLAILLFVGLSYLGIRQAHTFLSPLAPSVAFVVLALGQTAFDYAEERRNKRQITRAFSQYISPDLVKKLSDDPSQLKLGGERRELSVLFSDVRGFTTIAETMKDDPQQLTTLINRLLTPLSDVVMDHGGTIDKYMGDCIMAFWNAPIDDPDHAIHAVETALHMQKALADLNVDLEREALRNGVFHHVMKMGIGINTGEAVVGNMGSNRRFDYSCLGDSVNLASRLEGTSKSYGVTLLLGEETARQVSGRFTVVELDRIKVKGKTLPSPIFTVVHHPTEAAIRLHEAFVAKKFAGELEPDDPLFAQLEELLPELKAYYEIMRDNLVAA